MPKYHPTLIISDCWSSIGDITFYHRNGQCFYKRKPYTQFGGTSAQVDQTQIHHRAILAWLQLHHSVQLEWCELAKTVPSHRPPYDTKYHISGYNLFVSSYHGFAQFGCEHVPEPQPFPKFPSIALEILELIPNEGVVTMHCRLTLADINYPERWNLSARIQLTKHGVGLDPGKMRSYMGTPITPVISSPCLSSVEVIFVINSIIMPEYQIYMQYRLIDSVTGYRNNWNKMVVRKASNFQNPTSKEST